MVLLALMGVEPALAQAPAERTMFEGPCTGAQNGTEIGCDGKGVLMTFRNGRTMVSVTGRTVASIGFAGKMQTTSPTYRLLWVDAAYVNQIRGDADGQCSIEEKGGATEVSCRAILRDGRTLVASPAEATAKDASTPSFSIRADDCPGLIRTHGFLSRAQFQCGYRHYSPTMTGDARRCMPQLGEQKSKGLLDYCMQTFDRTNASAGTSRSARRY